MTLAEVREKFVSLSGRYDLVVDATSYKDAGADFFVQAGQRWLDREMDFQGSWARITASISAGESKVELDQEIIAIKSVGLRDSSAGDFWYLDRREYQDLQKKLENNTSADRGTPRYWAPAIWRDDLSSTLSNTFSVLVYPESDSSYTLFVEGFYESDPLADEGDESFWSLYHPDILIKAALMKAEPFMRNRSGEQDFKASLLADLRQLDHDVVEQQIAEIDQVDNTWREIED